MDALENSTYHRIYLPHGEKKSQMDNIIIFQNNTYKSNYFSFQENIFKQRFIFESKNLEKLTPDDFNEIIITRIISSFLSIFFCLICVIIYLFICVKKSIQNKSEIMLKNANNQMDGKEKNENLDDENEDKNEKNQSFLTVENYEEEKVDFRKNSNADINTSQNDKYYNNQGQSFQYVLENNKSVEISPTIFDPYNTTKNYSLSNEEKCDKFFPDKIRSDIINPYDRENSNSHRLTEYKKNYIITSDIVNHYKSTVNAINNDSDTGNNFTDNRISNDDEPEFENEEVSEYNDSSYGSYSSNSKDFYIESKSDKKIKIGIINNILFLLILSNLFFALCSIFVFDANSITLKNFKNDDLCVIQAFTQNYFDLASICLTTIISLLMRGSQRYINLKRLRNNYKYYIIYSIFAPLVFCVGPLLTNSLGPTGPWCWINSLEDNAENLTWGYVIYLFCWMNISIITYKFYRLISYFNSRCQEIKNNQNRNEERKYIKKSKYVMYAFPTILIFSKLPATVNRCIVLMFDEQNKILYHLQACFSVLLGFFNSIVFVFIHRRYLFTK